LTFRRKESDSAADVSRGTLSPSGHSRPEAAAGCDRTTLTEVAMSRLTISGTDIRLQLQPGETILAGLHRNGYAVTAGCRRGGCGICKVDLVDGAVSYPQVVADTVLSRRERTGGVCLICRAVPEGDVGVAIPPGFKLRCLSPFLAVLSPVDRLTG
jgi:CDP-4-dehydro-6-deoxyglucose reductase